jgi:uncharacterized protein (TIGR03790 family)
VPGTRLAAAFAMLLGASAASGAGPAQPAAAHPEVLILVNERDPRSVAIGEAYRQARGVPPENVLRLAIEGAPESVSQSYFAETVRKPVEEFLETSGAKDRIEVIVTTKGLPLAITGEMVEPRYLLRDFRNASLEAELALLFSDAIGSPGVAGSPNPYLGSKTGFRDWKGRGRPLRYLVARLDAYPEPADPATGVPADVLGEIARATATGAAGRFVVDEDPTVPTGRDAGNRLLLAPTAAAIRALGLPLLHETTGAPVFEIADIAGLATWGSNAANAHNIPGPPFFGKIRGRLYPGRFAVRAPVVALVSTDMRSFAAPPQYGQSLAADLLRLGAAGATGHVSEPALAGVPRPYVLLREYALGTKIVEAYYRSVPFLGWTNTYVGDPLMTFAKPVARSADQDGDGVPDASDVCRDLPNPDQRDTNGDGYGNLCDADVDGDGRVTSSFGRADKPGDLERIAIAAQEFRYVPDYDLDGDGKVNIRDVSLGQITVFQRPGPGVRKAAPGPEPKPLP